MRVCVRACVRMYDCVCVRVCVLVYVYVKSHLRLDNERCMDVVCNSLCMTLCLLLGVLCIGVAVDRGCNQRRQGVGGVCAANPTRHFS